MQKLGISQNSKYEIIPLKKNGEKLLLIVKNPSKVLSNIIQKLSKPPEIFSIQNISLELTGLTGDATANDDFDLELDRDWHIFATGTNFAWDEMIALYGSVDASSAKVAVIDTGINPYHAELDDTLINGSNVVDPTMPTHSYESAHVHDDHGTQAASFISGEHLNTSDLVEGFDFDNYPFSITIDSNHILSTPTTYGNWDGGMTGIANKAKIVPIKAKLASDPLFPTPELLTAIDLAAAQADIVSMSIGIVSRMYERATNGTINSDIGYYSAFANHPETSFVISAGNEGYNLSSSDADYEFYLDEDTYIESELRKVAKLPNVLIVGGTDKLRNRAEYVWDNNGNLTHSSNFGSSVVDICAPSVRMLGATSELQIIDLQPGVLPPHRLPTLSGMKPYMGTSASAPLVAGTLALMKARFSQMNPNQRISKMLCSTIHDNNLADEFHNGRFLWVHSAVANNWVGTIDTVGVTSKIQTLIGFTFLEMVALRMAELQMSQAGFNQLLLI